MCCIVLHLLLARQLDISNVLSVLINIFMQKIRTIWNVEKNKKINSWLNHHLLNSRAALTRWAILYTCKTWCFLLMLVTLLRNTCAQALTLIHTVWTATVSTRSNMLELLGLCHHSWHDTVMIVTSPHIFVFVWSITRAVISMHTCTITAW